VLADRTRVPGAGKRIEALAQNPGVLGARVRVAGASDEVFAPAGSRVLPRGIETDAPLVVVRVRGGRVIHAACAGANRVRVSGMERGEIRGEGAFVHAASHLA
jgi:hypothetical protein